MRAVQKPVHTHDDANCTVFLFSYGSLQKKSVQIENFGRELTGRADELCGWVRRMVPIGDASAAAGTDESHYANAEPSANPDEAVPGTVFAITPEELDAADEYEQRAEYRRTPVALRSGTQAWIYVRS
jgi:hypothetical protein